MRALCGAIVTAGALIGLGLTSIGFGLRFQGLGPGIVHPETHQLYGIPTLVLIIVLLVIGLLVGVTVTFIGLAYHHERRFRELQREHTSSQPPASVLM